MPIFQDDMNRGQATPPAKTEFPFRNPPPARDSLRRQASEESIRTELCEGPVSESPRHLEADLLDDRIMGEEKLSQGVSDRVEFIERLKRGESPTWVPNRHVSVTRSQTQSASPVSRI